MSDVPREIHSLHDLRTYILLTLCDHENLIPEQYRLQESKLIRRGTECGRQFTLHGPRSVRLGAVWASDRNDLFFTMHAANGFEKNAFPVRLPPSPMPPDCSSRSIPENRDPVAGKIRILTRTMTA